MNAGRLTTLARLINAYDSRDCAGRMNGMFGLTVKVRGGVL